MIHWRDESIAALVETGFQVARFDNRDSGHSTHCADQPPYTLADMADDTVAVIDAAGWATANIFGVSFGGMIAQVTAARHPQRARSLHVYVVDADHESSGDPASVAHDRRLHPHQPGLPAWP